MTVEAAADPAVEHMQVEAKKLLPMLLPANVAAIAGAANKEGGQRWSATMGVQVKRLAEDRYRVEATNGRIAARVEGPMESSLGYPLDALPAKAAMVRESAIVPVKVLQTACKAVPQRGKAILNNLAVAMASDGMTYLCSTDLEQVTTHMAREVEGRFPSIDQAMPNKLTVEVAFDVDFVLEILKIARTYTDDTAKSVTMEFHGTKATCSGGLVPVVVRVKNAQGQEFTGVIMPLVVPDK